MVILLKRAQGVQDVVKSIAFWAYGLYQPTPHLIYHSNKAVKTVINWFIKKGFTK